MTKDLNEMFEEWRTYFCDHWPNRVCAMPNMCAPCGMIDIVIKEKFITFCKDNAIGVVRIQNLMNAEIDGDIHWKKVKTKKAVLLSKLVGEVK